MNFGEAIEAAKDGKAVARTGWNGKNMRVFLNFGIHDSDKTAYTIAEGVVLLNGVRANLFDEGDRGTVTRMPNLNMVAADGSIVTGWLASQTDMLAEDWQVVV